MAGQPTYVPRSLASQLWKTENRTARAIKEYRTMDHWNLYSGSRDQTKIRDYMDRWPGVPKPPCQDALKVARYSFSGSIPPTFERKLRRHKQRFGKTDTTVVLDKDENLLWSGLQWHRSCHSSEMTPLPILHDFSALGTVLPKSFTGTFSYNSRLDVLEV